MNALLKQVFEKLFRTKLKIFSLGKPVKSVQSDFGTFVSDENGHTPDVSILFFPVNHTKDLAKARVGRETP